MFYGVNQMQGSVLDTALEAIHRIYPEMFASDMLIALGKSVGYLEDAKFVKAIEAEASTEQERSLVWRLHVLCWAATNALKLKGDFVECGVLRGYCTGVVARYLEFGKQARTWYLYDTFSGVPSDQMNPGHPNPDEFLDPSLHDTAKRRFEQYPNIRVVRGRVPEVLAEVSPQSIAFMHLDMNSAAAELGALETLFDRMVIGAHLILDDYGWLYYRHQKAAEDTFFRQRDCAVLELPTGQGLVIKTG